MVSKLFGGSTSTTTQTSPFANLPQFAQQAFETGVGRAEAASQRPELFAPTPFVPQQEQALGQLGTLPTGITPEQFEQALATFLNPFEEQALQGIIQDIQRGSAGIQSDISSITSAAGGFGGTREALFRSEQARNTLEEIGDVSARSRAAAFETASDRALQSIGREQDLERQNVLDLLGAGDIRQQQATAQQQAEIEAINFLLSAAQGIPTAVTGISKSTTDKGIIPGITGLASQATGLGKIATGVSTLF